MVHLGAGRLAPEGVGGGSGDRRGRSARRLQSRPAAVPAATVREHRQPRTASSPKGDGTQMTTAAVTHEDGSTKRSHERSELLREATVMILYVSVVEIAELAWLPEQRFADGHVEGTIDG